MKKVIGGVRPTPGASVGSGVSGSGDGAAAAFLATLSGPVGQATFEEAVDALLDGVAAPPPHADLACAAVALGRAVDAAGGFEALPRRGPAVIVVTVPSATWVDPVAAIAGACLGQTGNAAAWPVVIHGDGSLTSHSPDKRKDEVIDALRGGALLVGISQDPARFLPADLVRVAERRLTLGPLDAADVGRVVAAATGEAPRSGIAPGLAGVCDPDDLALTVHAVRGADASIARLAAVLTAKAGSGEAGPGLGDLHGYGAAREWGLALVADLTAWRTGAPDGPRWSDLESAILLSGPPGVGKTTFAGALARSAGLPLLAGSLAQWQSARDGHLGHTLGAMRAFFERARRAPCVALIDEIDSFGDRNSFQDHHRDYSSQVMNALLEHLDGATSREGVVIVAATNHPGRLDPALLRAGRLDRHVRIGLPDADDLGRILRQHLGDDLPDLETRRVAARLVGMSGADVAGLVRRARGTARRSSRPLGADDLGTAVDQARPELPEHSRRRIAVHESGHLVAAAAGGMPGPFSASIDSDGGTAWVGHDPGAGIATEAALERTLVVMLAGRAAEEVALGQVSTGASADLASATRLASLMETRFGFSARMPLLTWDARPEDLPRMPDVAEAVHLRLTGAYDRAVALMHARRGALRRLTDGLVAKGRLGDAEVRRLLRARVGPRGRAA